MANSLHLVRSNSISLHEQVILTLGRNVFELFFVFLYTDYFSDIHKQSQKAFAHDAYVENNIWSYF